MQLVKIGVATLNQTPLDFNGNTSRIIEALNLAKQQQIQILTLPELALSGYGCEDAFFAPDTIDCCWNELLKILPRSKGIIANIGLPVRFQGALFNTVAVVCDGELVGLIPKKILAGDGVHYEPRWFKEWPMGHSDHFSFEQNGVTKQIPIGDFYFQWKSMRFGYEICEEAWVARRPGARLAEQSVDLILNPSASHFSFGKNEIRKRFVLEGSRAFSCVYVYANLVGNESGRIIFDGSLFIASQGELIAESERFSFRDCQILAAVIDLNINRTRRSQSTSFRPALDASTLGCVSINSLHIPNCPPDAVPTKIENLKPILNKNEEFLRAVSLGLFDYLRKSFSQGYAISLSGGIDSSVVTVLSASAIELAYQEIGLDAIKQKLWHIKSIQNCSTVSEVLNQLIHCAYQATQNSSKETREAAIELAQALGVRFSEWSIENIKQYYESTIGNALGRTLSWPQDDLALQNIQARVRAPGIWLLANVKNFLLLATSNRSEAAVGYATMDGDTAGGLSPIAGVDKAFLGQWIRWKAENPQCTLGPIPALQLVYRIPPTAELRPQQYQQTDEADLMPYPVLDFIERHLLIDRLKPIDILKVLVTEFTKYQPQQLRNWLVRFLKLWVQNQWKRERFAPSFHLDTESLDPKTWCRFPILSRAFENDIKELNALTFK